MATKKTTTKKTTTKSKGLGDTVKKITDATGISKLVHSVFGEDCGCKERQERLNKLFKYKVLCLEEEEYLYLKELFKNLGNTLDGSKKGGVLRIYQRVINPKQKMTNCQSCWSKIISQLKGLVTQYDLEIEEQKKQ